jgi:hypothetical protein
MSECGLPNRVSAVTNNIIQIRMGQRDRDRALLRFRRQLRHLGTLEQLERRQGAHSFLDGVQVDCLDILLIPWHPVRQHVR